MVHGALESMAAGVCGYRLEVLHQTRTHAYSCCLTHRQQASSYWHDMNTSSDQGTSRRDPESLSRPCHRSSTTNGRAATTAEHPTRAVHPTQAAVCAVLEGDDRTRALTGLGDHSHRLEPSHKWQLRLCSRLRAVVDPACEVHIRRVDTRNQPLDQHRPLRHRRGQLQLRESCRLPEVPAEFLHLPCTVALWQRPDRHHCCC